MSIQTKTRRPAFGAMYEQTAPAGEFATLYRIVGSDTLAVGRIAGEWYVADVSDPKRPHAVGGALPRREEARAVALRLFAVRARR